jgi:predicted SprT family Zn-dependent metalloprotease
MDHEELKAWALERIKYWTDFYRAIYPPIKTGMFADAGARYPVTTFSNSSKRVAGTAQSLIGHIILNTTFLFELGKGFERTIAHEVAHCVADQHVGYPCKHGPVWKSVQATCGLGNKRCHTYDCTTHQTILWECPACTRHHGATKGHLTRFVNNGASIVKCTCSFGFNVQDLQRVLTTGKHEPWKATISTSSNCIKDWCKRKVIL